MCHKRRLLTVEQAFVVAAGKNYQRIANAQTEAVTKGCLPRCLIATILISFIALIALTCALVVVQPTNTLYEDVHSEAIWAILPPAVRASQLPVINITFSFNGNVTAFAVVDTSGSSNYEEICFNYYFTPFAVGILSTAIFCLCTVSLAFALILIHALCICNEGTEGETFFSTSRKVGFSCTSQKGRARAAPWCLCTGSFFLLGLVL